MNGTTFKTSAISFVCVIMAPIKIEECSVVNVNASLTNTVSILPEIHIRGIGKLG